MNRIISDMANMLCDIEVGLGSNHDTANEPFSIPGSLRFRHSYLLGKTGTGKSTLMQNMIQSDIEQPYCTVVFDSGDLIPSLMQSLPHETILNRVDYFSIAENPIAYNPLLRRRDDPGRLENEIFSLLDQVTVESSNTAPLSARMKRVLSVALREVLKQKEPTLADLVTHLLENKQAIRKRLMLREDEFTATHEAVIDRISQCLRDPRPRRVLCAPHELDFDAAIDGGRILLFNFSGLEKPLVRLLGTIFFHALSCTVLERPIERRRPVSCYIDEYGDYISSHLSVSNFQTIFSQGRRYQIGLTVAHQDFGSVDPDLLHSIHGNAATIISFSCGPDEALKMSKIFGHEGGGGYSPYSIGFLADHHAICRAGGPVLYLETYPPPESLRHPLVNDLALPEDPPDPVEEFLNRYVERNIRKEGREPKIAGLA